MSERRAQLDHHNARAETDGKRATDRRNGSRFIVQGPAQQASRHEPQSRYGLVVACAREQSPGGDGDRADGANPLLAWRRGWHYGKIFPWPTARSSGRSTYTSGKRLTNSCRSPRWKSTDPAAARIL